MRKVYLFITLACFSPYLMLAQDYLGAGNSSGITVHTSSEYEDPKWPQSSAGINTVNDQGMLVDYFEAHRFLTQASLGFEDSHIQQVMSMGIEGWIDDQLIKPPSYLYPAVENVFEIIKDSIDAYNASQPPSEQIDYPRRPNWGDFNYAWWQVNTMNEDLLRHKVAAALSEILVISRLSDISGYGDGMATYYDLLLDGAFGNYEDLLYNVTLSPMMGQYLSHLNNPKSNPEEEIHPDENFAREVMQLFSIGLYELDLYGNRIQQNGKDVATYDNDDIKEFAKVFTGLGVGELLDHLKDDIIGNWDDEVYFGHGLWVADVSIPMRMWDTDDPGTWRDEDQHEDGAKYLLNGFTVPAGQSGLADIEDAIHNLFMHNNVGPFLARRLIQRLVKSNPSPQYIFDVASKFNNDGSGTRGNMGAVIKEILTHDEARLCNFQLNDENSKLKEPLFRYTQFSRMMDKSNPLGLYWNINYDFREATGQDILASPSVFNFFLYDDAPNGPIHDQGLVAPEYKIHDSRTSVGYYNSAFRWTIYRDLMAHWDFDYPNNYVHWDIDNLLPLAEDPESYINWIDQHVLGGNLTDRTRTIMRNAINGYYPGAWNWQERRITLGMYLALISPEYSVMR